VYTIVPFTHDRLEQLTYLVNVHTSAVVPGWAVPEAVIAARLERDPGERVVNPWVVERRTLVAIERDRVVAATHLLRYGADERVGPAYKGQSEIAWLLAWPNACEAGADLLETAIRQLKAWQAPRFDAFGTGLDMGDSGIPDAWPHIAELARNAGFVPDPERTEYLHAGWIPEDPAPVAPVAGLSFRRTAVDDCTRFTALLDDKEIGIFDVNTIEGLERPAMRGWASPWNLWIEPEHRNKGIGSWLVRSACPWLRLAGADRMAVETAADDHANGSGRFYERLGWPQIAVFERAWSRPRNGSGTSVRRGSG
jgi:GNAT superfamily N-acetyltransferase